MDNDFARQRGRLSAQIWVAIIGLLGVLGTALFANWDRIFPTSGAEDSASNSASTPSATENAEPPPTGSKVSSFLGHWKNENADTGGITKIDIDFRLGQIIVHNWGSCQPTDCDWGTRSVKYSERVRSSRLFETRPRRV